MSSTVVTLNIALPQFQCKFKFTHTKNTPMHFLMIWLPKIIPNRFPSRENSYNSQITSISHPKSCLISIEKEILHQNLVFSRKKTDRHQKNFQRKLDKNHRQMFPTIENVHVWISHCIYYKFLSDLFHLRVLFHFRALFDWFILLFHWLRKILMFENANLHLSWIFTAFCYIFQIIIKIAKKKKKKTLRITKTK